MRSGFHCARATSRFQGCAVDVPLAHPPHLPGGEHQWHLACGVCRGVVGALLQQRSQHKVVAHLSGDVQCCALVGAARVKHGAAAGQRTLDCGEIAVPNIVKERVVCEAHVVQGAPRACRSRWERAELNNRSPTRPIALPGDQNFVKDRIVSKCGSAGLAGELSDWHGEHPPQQSTESTS